MKSLTIAMVVLCLAGVVVSILALREHYNLETSPCSINDRWDCGAVNHSMFAAIEGVPVAAIGILGYALLGILAGRFPRLTVLGAVAGLGFALRLSYIEWRVLEVWCIYCVASQGIIAAIALLAVTDLFAVRRAQAHS
jgi:vitamin-K-epoxide reductase (warfarin-sensitive)